MGPNVKINSDPPERIADLYGIGPATARKIADYRAAHGPFHGPDDLAKVDGVRLELARLLAPHIDWKVEVQAMPVQTKERSWSVVVVLIPLLALVSYFGIPIVQDTIYVMKWWDEMAATYPDFWVTVWMSISSTGLYLAAFLVVGMEVISSLTTSQSVERSTYRAARWVMLYSILTVSFLGLGNLFYYSMYAPGRWSALWNDTPALIGLVSGFMLAAWALPVVFLIFKPNLRMPERYIRITDIMFALIAVLMAVFWWFLRESAPVWFSLLWGAYGVLMFVSSYAAIRRQTSMFGEFFNATRNALTGSEDSVQASSSYWLTWVNSHLPNPDEQQALKEALEKAYPQSKTRTALNIVVIGSATWLILTSLSAVVQWFVEKLLDRAWPF